MKPEEEARRLINKFTGYVSSETMTKHHDENRQLFNAKECAIFCVNEILKAVTTIADKKYDFWQEVKKEIEKL